jgi:hypothetical protein
MSATEVILAELSEIEKIIANEAGSQASDSAIRLIHIARKSRLG